MRERIAELARSIKLRCTLPSRLPPGKRLAGQAQGNRVNGRQSVFREILLTDAALQPLLVKPWIASRQCSRGERDRYFIVFTRLACPFRERPLTATIPSLTELPEV